MVRNFEPVVRVENVVANARIARKLDLDKIESKVSGTEYNRKKFPGLVYRLAKPKVVFLLFGTGRIVCTGAKSAEDVYIGVERLIKYLNSSGIETGGDPSIVIQNIVATSSIGSAAIDLNAVALSTGLENVEYEPEVFPGLVYRMEDPHVVILIFSSGKIVITGGKTKAECARAAEKLAEKMSNAGLI